ncbi:MAG: hypothetical protein ACF8PN_03690 [Phycisphaerales bacterium]
MRRERNSVESPDLNARILATLAWIGVGVQAGASIWLAAHTNWRGAAVMAGFTVGTIFTLVLRTRLPRLFSLLFVSAGFVNAAGFAWDLFENENCVWYDEAAHAYTSLMVALVISFWMYYGSGRVRPIAVFVTLATLATLGVGIAWEIFEWLVGILGPPRDTVLDLVMDLVGGVGGALSGAWAIRYCHPECLVDYEQVEPAHLQGVLRPG